MLYTVLVFWPLEIQGIPPQPDRGELQDSINFELEHKVRSLAGQPTSAMSCRKDCADSAYKRLSFPPLRGLSISHLQLLSTWSIVNLEQWSYSSCFLSSECSVSLRWPRLMPNWMASIAAKEYVAKMKKRAAQLGAVLTLLSAALKFQAVANTLSAALKAARPAVALWTLLSAVLLRVAVAHQASPSVAAVAVVKLGQHLRWNPLRCSCGILLQLQLLYMLLL